MTPTFKGGYALATAMLASSGGTVDAVTKGGALVLLALLLLDQSRSRDKDRKQDAINRENDRKERKETLDALQRAYEHTNP